MESNYLDKEFDIDFDKYLSRILDTQISKFKDQYEFSSKMILDIKKENEKEEDLNDLLKCPIEDLKRENIIDNHQFYLIFGSSNYNRNDDNKNKNNFINKKIIKTEYNKRISKKLISKKLNIYFEVYPNKWSRNYVKEISKETNLPLNTIYKWNWNKIKLKQSLNKSHYN